MRALNRNKREFYYCTLDEATAQVVDANVNRTGETIPVYDDAVSMMANISPASGYAQAEQFGDLTDYDHVIVTDRLDCPITETTVLFLEKAPEYREEQVRVIVPPRSISGVPLRDSDVPVIMTAKIPLYDYIVRRVSKSLNSVSIAISKVKVN